MGRNIRDNVSATKRSTKTFLGTYDDRVAVPNAIKAGLAALLKLGAEEWRYENEFCTFAKVATNKLSGYRAQFEAHIVEVSGRDRSTRNVWFADKKVAARMRKELTKSTGI
jgi:hypothetical protein